MDTPVVPKPIQGRRGKKHRMDFSSPANDDDLTRAIDLIIADQSLPPHLKAAMGCMLELKDQLTAVVARNKELVEENNMVRTRNTELESEVHSLRSQIGVLKQALSQQNHSQVSSQDSPMSSGDSAEDIERRRSIVVIGVKECSAPVSSAGVVHDTNCIRLILDFLSIECRPVAIYRMGRPVPGKARLLKVVFPASYFAMLTLKRAPHLRFFSEKGVFIRPSLSKLERDRLKVERLSRTQNHSSPSELVRNQQISSDTMNNSGTLMNSRVSLSHSNEFTHIAENA